jgi:para-aminobenzoate synthetase/4-amino-4-deoxychorismate lyase
LDAFRPDRLKPPYVLLEDRLTEGAGGQLYTEPEAVIRCEDPQGIEAAFDLIERGLAEGLHAAGLFSYELGYALEPKLRPLMPPRRGAPLIWMGLFGPPDVIGPAALDAAFARVGPPQPIRALEFAQDRARHGEQVQKILRLIEAGEVYQVNLTFPLSFHYDGDAIQLYAALRSRQPVRHGGMAALGDMAALSVSPELWLRVAEGQATTRPMKGTSAWGADPETDKRARERLSRDPKQRAENLMIVDLLRNDLARVARPGSVRVPELFNLETYPSLHTLTSTVTAQLAPHTTLRARIAALFPCGSIVGAPKIRAAEIIRSLEGRDRGVYTGALGAISPGGDMSFNVAIRTAALGADGQGQYGVGGGIVADSDPDAEYDEALLKARVLTDLATDYDLIETFRWSREVGFVRLVSHLNRMARSAGQLGFAFDRLAAEAALSRLAAVWGPGRLDQRVRLALTRAGTLAISHAAVAASKPFLTIGLAKARLDPGDPFLRHKTSRREIYERAFEAASAQGLDEALFLNRRGEVAEASRHSVFVEVNGRLVTPHLSDGVLPGVLRQHLIETGEAVEARVSMQDLHARPLMLGNSLHGLRPARLAPAAAGGTQRDVTAACASRPAPVRASSRDRRGKI